MTAVDELRRAVRAPHRTSDAAYRDTWTKRDDAPASLGVASVSQADGGAGEGVGQERRGVRRYVGPSAE